MQLYNDQELNKKDETTEEEEIIEVLGGKYKEKVETLDDRIKKIEELIDENGDLPNKLPEYFIEFYADNEEFYTEMIQPNGFDEFDDREFWDYWYDEIEFVYSELRTMRPHRFDKDLKVQIRRLMPKIRLLKQIKDKPLENIDDIVTKSLSKSKSLDNNSPFQDTQTQAFTSEGELILTNSQSSQENESFRTSNVNMQKQIINNEFFNGLRELAHNLEVLFRKTLTDRPYMDWRPEHY